MVSLRASALVVLLAAAGACDDGGAGDGGVRDANVSFDGSGACGDAGCAAGLTCCGGACVNTVNDPHHCGLCERACAGPSPFCSGGSCDQAPCNPGTVCSTAGTLCCGDTCCGAGQLCCEVDRGGPSRGPECVAPVAGSCPVGCPLCL
jgi:hypothetical protein